MADSIGSSVDAAVAAVSSKATHAGLATTLGGWLLSSEAAIVIGILMSIGGFLTNLYFRRREYRRREMQDTEYHAARMSALRAGRIVDES